MERQHDRNDHELRLAAVLADGELIDWAVEQDSHPEHRSELIGLRKIEAVRRDFSRCKSKDSTASDATRGRNGGDEPAGRKIPAFWGNLSIDKLLGEGGFAQVFRAYDPRLDTHVALKLLREECIPVDGERFLDEARRLAQVHHPNVVTVHYAAEHDGRPGFTMSLLKGKNLEKRIEEQGTLGWHEAVTVGIEMCSALAAIHAVGLVHGDVKTKNIVQLENDGRLVIADFGAAVEALPATGSWSQWCGTTRYMAPEIFLGSSPQSPAGDIYSLGVLLYRLVSGSYPVEAQTDALLAEKHRRGEPVPLVDRRPDLPQRFVQVVERALSRAPAKRFASAGKMQQALLEVLEQPVAWWRKPLVVWSDLSAWQRRALKLSLSALMLLFAGFAAWTQRALEFDAALYRVQGVPEQRQELEPGAQLQPGDQLCLDFRGSRDAYVYVVNDTGLEPSVVNALFPLEGFDQTNPLRSRAQHVLPGKASGLQSYWNVSDKGGRERILIVASRFPLKSMDQLAERGMSSSIEENASKEPLRDITSLPPPGPSSIDEILRTLGKPNRNLQWMTLEHECNPAATK